MRILIAGLAAAALMFTVEAPCAVYMWVDEQGVTGFAEDYGKVPEKYRKKAKLVGQEQEDETEAESGEETQGGKQQSDSGSDLKGGSQAVPAKTEQKHLFGGRDETYWANEFGRLKADLRGYRDQLDAINTRLSNTEQMSRSEYKSLDNTRKLLEEQEGAARRKLEALTLEANKAGVPPDIR